MDLQDLIRRIDIPEHNVLCVYQYGSRVYGTNRSHSDWDFIVITNRKTREQFSDNLVNVTFYSPNEFQDRLDAHEISALECYFLWDRFIWKTVDYVKFKFKLSLPTLRHSLSAKSSNSWVKAKKKLTIPQDYDLDLGKKSLFHSYRIIDFGIQIALYDRIIEYDNCNPFFNEVMNSYDDWESLFEQYKFRYNQKMSRFRELAPKE